MKRRFMRIISLIMAFVMTMGLCVTAFADSNYTITIENATADKTYSAYKIFDATYDETTGGVTYTISKSSGLYNVIAGMSEVFTLTSISGTEKYYVTANNTEAEIIEALEGIGIDKFVTASASTKTETSGSLTLDVGEPGYYYVTSELGAVVSIDTAHPTATIIDKNETVGGEKFHKYVKDSNGNWVVAGDAALGDELEFNITSNVPLYEGENIVLEYKFTDTLAEGSGLEIEIYNNLGEAHLKQEPGTDRWLADASLIEQFVTLTDSNNVLYNLSDVAFDITLEFTDCSYNESTGYIVAGGFILTYYTYDTKAYENDGTFDISKYPTDLTINIKYKAYVTDNASHDETNTAELVYYTTKFSNPDPENPVPAEVQNSTDHVLEWDLKILKIDGENKNHYLEGAEFTLEGEDLNHVKVSTTVTYTEIDRDQMKEGVTYYYLTSDGRYITTSPDIGIGAGIIYDENHPGPYVRTVTTDIENVGGDTGSHTADGVTAKDGTLIFDGLTAGTYTLKEIKAPEGYNLLDGSLTIVIKWDSEKGKFFVDTDATSHQLANVEITEDGELQISIENATGSTLPSTGGIGTTIFYIIGAILILAAAALVVTKWRLGRSE